MGACAQKERDVGFFEENPWLLIPIIILTVESWNAVKAVVREKWRRRESSNICARSRFTAWPVASDGNGGASGSSGSRRAG
jgi:hypothetical protein